MTETTPSPPPPPPPPPAPAPTASWFAPWSRYGGATLAIICATVCVCAVIAWVTSYLPPTIVWGSWHGALRIAGMGLSEAQFDEYAGAAGGYGAALAGIGSIGDVYHHFLGFAYTGGSAGRLGWFRIIAIPYWFIVLVTAIVPVRWWRRHRRRRRWQTQGRCPGCGYNLTGTPDHCPECGWRHAPAAHL